MRVDGFDWDTANWPKCGKHGVSKAEIESAIEAVRYVVDDPNSTEKRYRAPARASTGRYVFVVFALRPRGDQLFLRPISARYMHSKEIQTYETQMAQAGL